MTTTKVNETLTAPSIKFKYSQTIKLSSDKPLMPVELIFGDKDIKKFMIERMGSNKIRFVLPITDEEFHAEGERLLKEAEKKIEMMKQPVE